MLINTNYGVDLYQDNLELDVLIVSFPKEDFQKVLTGTQYTHLTTVLRSIDYENQTLKDLDRHTVKEENVNIEFGDYLRIYYNIDQAQDLEKEEYPMIWMSDYETAKNWNHTLLDGHVP
jgi:hypothetical protein